MIKGSIIKALALTIGFSCAVPASLAGAIYEYTSPDLNGVYDANYRYNSGSGAFSLNFDFTSNVGGKPVDGFWFVNSTGPGGVGITDGQYAIFYSDMKTVWAYQYTGWNGGANDSYTSRLLQRWDKAVSVTTSADGKTIRAEMDINVANLNALSGSDLERAVTNWTGMHFTNKLGTWLHPTYNTAVSVDGSGALSNFNSRQWIGWDESNRPTTEVSEPASLALIASGVLGLVALRRRQRA